MKARAKAALLVLLLAAAPVLAGPPPAALEGSWQGSFQGSLRIVFRFERSPGGALRGVMDSPDQGATGIAMDSIWTARDTVFFQWNALRIRYDAALASDGRSLDGVWRQGGVVVPFAMKRLEKAPDYRRPQDPVKPYPYGEEEVTYRNAAAGVTLAGTLTIPMGKGPFPCVVLITGSGPENRNEEIFGHRPFLVLADHLTRKGIAVLRVDDRGVGGSTGTSLTATSEDFAGDVMAGLAYLKTRPEIDASHLGLIGHSEGGLIAPMVATRSKDVAFIVLMAGPGVPGDSILTLQGAALRRSIGVSEAAIARESVVAHQLYAMIRRGDSLGTARAARELVKLQLQGLSEAQRRAAGDPEALAQAAVRQLDSPWIRYFVGYDPRPALRHVTCPVLALNGSRDLQVAAPENLAAIRDALADGKNPDYTVRGLPGLNHLFQTCETGTIAEYSTLDETLAPAALDAMSRWILLHSTRH